MAVAAAVLNRLVVEVGRGGGDKLADKAVAAQRGVDEEGVASYPPQPGTGGPEFVADGSRVHTGTCLEVGIMRAEGGNELVEHPFDTLVIVFAIGILGNAGGPFHAARGFIAQQDRDDGAGTRMEHPRVGAEVAVLLHIMHVGMEAVCNPFIKVEFLRGQRCSFGQATGVESHGGGDGLDNRRGEGGGVHGLFVFRQGVFGFGRLVWGGVLGTVLFEAAFEEFELEETAVELAVEEGYFLGGFEPDVLQGFEVAADKPHLAVLAVFALEGVAQLLVHGVKVLNLYALAVGRVGDNEGAAFRGVLVLEGAVEEHDILVKLGELQVLLGLGKDGEVYVVAPYLVVKVGGAYFAVFLLLDAFPFAEVKLLPAAESKAVAAVVLGGDVHGHHGSLDEEGAGATHGVVEVGVALPAGELDHASGKHLVDGGKADGLTVAALVEGVATGVDEQGDVVVAYVEVEFVVGILGVDGRPLSEVAAEAVHNGILGFQGGIVGMGEDVAACGAVNHEGAVHVEDFFPTDAVNLVVEFLLVVGFELSKRFEDGQSGAAGVVGTIEQPHVAFEKDCAVDALDVFGTHGAELVGKNFFKAHHGLGNHSEFLFCGVLYGYGFAVLFLDYHGLRV